MKLNNVELIILGSGTCIPSQKRGASGIILKINSENLLFDSGSGTLNKLVTVNVDYRKFKYLFYTHTHADHTADLIPIIQAIRVSPQFHRTETLYICGPPQFSNFIEKLSQAYGAWLMEPNFEIIIKELNHHQVEFPFGKISTAPMKHSNYSIDYRIDTEYNKSVTYSGDTDYCEEIITLATDCDVLILECSFPDEQKLEGHLTPTLAATIAAASNCRHLILTHFYPDCEDIDIISICRKIFHGKISLAYDLMHVVIQ